MVTYTNMGFGIELAALLICLTNILFTIVDRRTGKPQNRVYLSILAMLAVNAACEMVTIHFTPLVQTSDSAFLAVKIANYIYFLSHCIIPPLYCYYISFVIGRSVGKGALRRAGQSKPYYIRHFLPVCLAVVTEAVLALNPLTEWCWYYDADRAFRRAWGEYAFVYSVAALWIVGAFIMTMMSWKILSKGRKHSISMCFALVLAGIMIQLCSPVYRVEVLMEALGFTGVLLFIENEDDRKNVELDAYNSAAFALDISAAQKNRIPLQVLILRNIRFDSTANTVVFGKLKRDSVIQAVSDYLGTVVKRYYIYTLGHGRFAVTLYDSTDDDAHIVAQTISDRFRQPWQIRGTDIVLTARIMLVRVPERAQTAADITYIAECPIPEHMQEKIIEGKSLDWIIRRAAVEDAVSHGMENGSFQVYYQPTYNLDNSLHGAEALLRMHDPKMGMIYPDEFIPVAEHLGMIDALDEFVLKEVCKFFLTGIPQKNGMDCINVNLSVLECMKEGFAEHVSGIVESAGVRKKLINFEITESVAAKDYGHLANVIDQLRQEGFQFSIDDYGTGYSNMTSLFSLGADIIKIDKSILWNAEQSELGMTLLKTSIEMVHQMQKKALMEGVETEAHIRILKELHCDYLQGFYFSKPLPQAEFIALIEQQK